MTRAQIVEWQKEFQNAPKVWYVEDKDGNPTNFYESRDAAECELAFYRRRRRERGYSVRSTQIHSLKLARERWGDADAPPAGGGQ